MSASSIAFKPSIVIDVKRPVPFISTEENPKEVEMEKALETVREEGAIIYVEKSQGCTTFIKQSQSQFNKIAIQAIEILENAPKRRAIQSAINMLNTVLREEKKIARSICKSQTSDSAILDQETLNKINNLCQFKNAVLNQVIEMLEDQDLSEKEKFQTVLKNCISKAADDMKNINQQSIKNIKEVFKRQNIQINSQLDDFIYLRLLNNPEITKAARIIDLWERNKKDFIFELPEIVNSTNIFKGKSITCYGCELLLLEHKFKIGPGGFVDLCEICTFTYERILKERSLEWEGCSNCTRKGMRAVRMQREGPFGKHTLCNACGIKARKRKKINSWRRTVVSGNARWNNDNHIDSDLKSIHVIVNPNRNDRFAFCLNCDKDAKHPQARRGPDGEGTLCNADGLTYSVKNQTKKRRTRKKRRTSY